MALSSAPGDPEAKAQGRASKARINLERTAILLIDNPLGLDILSHIFYGYGARQVFKCATAEEAMRIVGERELDLIVTEALLPDQDAYDFVRAIRGLGEQVANRFTPVMVLSAHTAVSKVTVKWSTACAGPRPIVVAAVAAEAWCAPRGKAGTPTIDRFHVNGGRRRAA